MAFAQAVGNAKAAQKPRRQQTDKQREIRTAERAHARASARQEQVAIRAGQRRIVEEAQIARARGIEEAATYEEIEAERTRGYYKRHVGTKVAGAVTKATAPVVNPLFLIIGVMAGLIIFYDLVTSAKNVEGFSNSLQNALSKLSTTSPLFTKVTTS